MAPDSQRQMFVLESSIAGTRPFGLILTYGSFFMSPMSLRKSASLSVAGGVMSKAHHHLGGVWDTELLENDDDLPVNLISVRLPCSHTVRYSTMGLDQSHGCKE